MLEKVFDELRQITWLNIFLVFLGLLPGALFWLGKNMVVEWIPYLHSYSRATGLLGRWYTYHWSRKSTQATLEEVIWTFERRPFGIRVLATYRDNPALYYKGALKFEHSSVVVICGNRKIPESFQARLPIPFPEEREPPDDDVVMVGIQLLQDFNHDIESAVKLCCRRPKTRAEAASLIAGNARVLQEQGLLRLARPD